MRYTISERNIDRLREYLLARADTSMEPSYRKFIAENLGTRSPGYTVDDALDALLKEVGF